MVKKIGRNEPCPCGSGKKYKKCCLKNNKPAAVENVPQSTWDFVNRWLVHHKGKEVIIVRQIAMTIDRETGEKLTHPYIAQMRLDGKIVRVLTRPEKIKVCRAIATDQLA